MTLFICIQPAVFFSHTKPTSAINQSQPAVLLSHNMEHSKKIHQIKSRAKNNFQIFYVAKLKSFNIFFRPSFQSPKISSQRSAVQHQDPSPFLFLVPRAHRFAPKPLATVAVRPAPRIQLASLFFSFLSPFVFLPLHPIHLWIKPHKFLLPRMHSS